MRKPWLVAARSLMSRGKTWKRAVSVMVFLLSIGFLVYRAADSWDALQAYDWRIRYIRIIPSFALFLLQFVVIAWGWGSIMGSLAPPLSLRNHIKIYAYTNLMRRIPAGVVWMIAGRAYAYKDHNIPARASALGSFLEFLIVVATGLPLCTMAGWGLEFYPLSVAGVLTVLALAIELGVLHPKVLDKAAKLARHPISPVELDYGKTLCWALTYTAIWLISGLGLFSIARIFADVSLQSLPVIIGVWVLSSEVSYLTVLSPSGLGVKELSLSFLLSVFLSEPLPLLIALGIRVIWTIYEIIVGGVSLIL